MTLRLRKESLKLSFSALCLTVFITTLSDLPQYSATSFKYSMKYIQWCQACALHYWGPISAVHHAKNKPHHHQSLAQLLTPAPHWVSFLRHHPLSPPERTNHSAKGYLVYSRAGWGRESGVAFQGRTDTYNCNWFSHAQITLKHYLWIF